MSLRKDVIVGDFNRNLVNYMNFENYVNDFPHFNLLLLKN